MNNSQLITLDPFWTITCRERYHGILYTSYGNLPWAAAVLMFQFFRFPIPSSPSFVPIPPMHNSSLVWSRCTGSPHVHSPNVHTALSNLTIFLCSNTVFLSILCACCVQGGATLSNSLFSFMMSHRLNLRQRRSGKGGRDVIWIQQQSGGDGGKRAVYFKMPLYHRVGLSEII